MSYVKNKKTVIHIGSSKPATATLADAVLAATVSFKCLLTSINGIELSRGTTTDDAVMCAGEESFKRKNTGELEISNFTAEGYVDDDDASGYAEVYELSQTMIKADTQGTFVITEPNGTDKIWFEFKFVMVGKPRGGAEDKQKFKIEAVAMTMPTDA